MKKTDLQDWVGNGRSLLRHIGFDFARGLRSRSRTGLRTHFFLLMIGLGLELCSLLAFLSVFYFEASNQSSFIALSVLYASSSVFIGFYLPGLSLFSLVKRKKKVLDLDLAFSALLLVLFAQNFFSESFSYTQAFLLQSFGFLYLCARLIEAKYLIPVRAKNPPWNLHQDFLSSLCSQERRLAWASKAIAIGIIVAFGFFLWQRNLISEKWPSLSLAGLSLFVPFSSWIYSRLFRQFSLAGVQLVSQKILFQMNRIRFLRFHCLGVLRDSKVSAPEIFQDPSSAWEDEQVIQLLRSLVQSSVHPMSLALIQHLGPSKSESWDVENLPYAGLRGYFRSPDGKKHELILSNYQWLRTNRYEFSPEMLRWEEKAVLDRALSSYFCIDGRVVAGICVFSPFKKDLQKSLAYFKNEGFRMGVWSSCSPAFLPTEMKEIDECSAELLPLEREIQEAHWKERSKDQVSVMSAWDPQEPGLRVVFHDQPTTSIAESEVHILGGELRSLVCLIEESKNFEARHRLAWMAPGLYAASLMLTTLYVGFSAGMFLFLLSLPLLAIYFGPCLKKEAN